MLKNLNKQTLLHYVSPICFYALLLIWDHIVFAIPSVHLLALICTTLHFLGPHLYLLFSGSIAYFVLSTGLFRNVNEQGLVAAQTYENRAIYLGIALSIYFALLVMKKKIGIRFPFITFVFVYFGFNLLAFNLNNIYLIGAVQVFTVGHWMIIYGLKDQSLTTKSVFTTLPVWNAFGIYPFIRPTLIHNALKNNQKTDSRRDIFSLKLLIGGILGTLLMKVLFLLYSTQSFSSEDISKLAVHVGEKFEWMRYTIMGELRAGAFNDGFSLTPERFLMNNFAGLMVVAERAVAFGLPIAIINYIGISAPAVIRNPFASVSFLDLYARIWGPIVGIVGDFLFFPAWKFFSKFVRSRKLIAVCATLWAVSVGRILLTVVDMGGSQNLLSDLQIYFSNWQKILVTFIFFFSNACLIFTSIVFKRPSTASKSALFIRSSFYFVAYMSTWYLSLIYPLYFGGK